MANTPRPAARPMQAAPSPRAASPAPKPAGKAVATTSTSSGALAIPEHMRGMSGMGMENVGAGDVETPRIKLLQGLSPEIKEYDDARPGHFWHHLANIDLGMTLKIVPIYIDQVAILWRPRKSGGGILARTHDMQQWSPDNMKFDVVLDSKKQVVWNTGNSVAGSRLLEWGSSDPDDPNSPPAGTRMYNIVCAMPDFPDLPPAVVTLQRSAIRVARRWLGGLRLARAPIFGLVFNMSAIEDHNSDGENFYNYRFTGTGFLEDPDLFAQYEQYYQAFKEMGLRIRDIDSLQGETDEANDRDGEAHSGDGKAAY